MYLLTIALLIPLVSHGNCYYSKCCKTGDYLAEFNSTPRCIENKLRRMYVVTNESDFLKNNSDGECVDVGTDFFIFKVTGGKIVGKRSVVEPIFPKCCPLNYIYNTVLHACEISDSDIEFVEGNLIKVGLPTCKIIVDHELNGTSDILLYHRLKHYASSGSFCFDGNEKGSIIYRECKKIIEDCEGVRCIKKCCPDGQSFINQSTCYDTYTHGLNLSTFTDIDKAEGPYAIISNRICPKIYMLQKNQYAFHLDENGTFELWQNKSKSFIPYGVSDMKSYCMEHTKTPTFDGYLFFMCFPEDPPVKKFEYTVWPKVLSCVSLVLTVLVYVILHETRNVFGKLLVNYCFALFFDNVLLIYAQMSLHPSHIICVLKGFGIIFFASAEFSWSNAVCYNIYRTIGSMQQTTGPLRSSLKKLLLYFLYAWGVPSVMTLVIVLFYNWRVLPNSIQPYIAEKKCFFEKKEENYSQALFFNLPHLFMQLVNTAFFIKTAVYCLKVKNEISKIKDTTCDDKNRRFQKSKERLLLILKLSVIMGISFMFEVISAFFDMKEMGTTAMYTEIIWDTINCLQGVFIFIIFVCKRKIYNDLLRKFKTSVPRNMSFSSLSTQTTAISSRTSKKSGCPETVMNP